MKKALMLMFVLLGVNAWGQDLPKNDDGLIEYAEVVQVSGFSGDDLYANAKAWFDGKYKATKKRKYLKDISKVADNQNLKADKIAGAVNYDIEIAAKDGKYRLVITNFVHKNFTKGKCSGGKLEEDEPLCRTGKMSGKTWSTIKQTTNDEVTKLIAEIKENMIKKEKEKSSDW